MTYPGPSEIGEITSSDVRPSTLSRAAGWLHKLEIAYVIVTMVFVFWSAAHADRNVGEFTFIWGIGCVAAACVALWPRTPRDVQYIAEVVLLVVALGQVIGPQHHLFPLLNREIRGASRWNDMPLTQRRIVTWNIISAFALIWGIPGLGLLSAVVMHARRHPLQGLGLLLLWTVVFGGLGLAFFLVVQAFFRG